MRKKGVGRVLRVRAVDRDTRVLQGDRRKREKKKCVCSLHFVCSLRKNEL